MENLDARIHQYSYEMVKDGHSEVLNLIDKALGVLANDGVYAYYVYCKSKNKKSKDKNENNLVERIFIKGIVDEFGETFGFDRNSKNGENRYEHFFSNLSKDIHSLLFFKEIVERILIYARYHAKAIGEHDGE
ncbi:hypothetical protein B6A27_05900 [Anoxybacillus sp. UARK-01]|uniref:hypothetical protein n=1 Tax=Anoxybacillus sp. UARK-01 TaxID=1895648 RepID=UPI0009BA3BF4|nr:hypothetical protein [Anoxybacillus sp. UARK-01]OQM46684.1 hypothetical protein B6A27_05900 [Anoxybacillus sp. UARK-01]